MGGWVRSLLGPLEEQTHRNNPSRMFLGGAPIMFSGPKTMRDRFAVTWSPKGRSSTSLQIRAYSWVNYSIHGPPHPTEIFLGPPGSRDPLQNLGRIGGNRSPLFPSKSVVIGPIFGKKKTVGPMYALGYAACDARDPPDPRKPGSVENPPKSLKKPSRPHSPGPGPRGPGRGQIF